VTFLLDHRIINRDEFVLKTDVLKKIVLSLETSRELRVDLKGVHKEDENQFSITSGRRHLIPGLLEITMTFGI